MTDIELLHALAADSTQFNDEYGENPERLNSATRARLLLIARRLVETDAGNERAGQKIDAITEQVARVVAERDAAVAWISCVCVELADAGFPRGDRTVALATIRRLIAKSRAVSASGTDGQGDGR